VSSSSAPLTLTQIAARLRALPPGRDKTAAIAAFEAKYGPALEAARALARKPKLQLSLHDFIREAWQYVEPSNPLSWNWHLDEICEVLLAIHVGRLRRVIFNVPPGTGKSIIISVLFNAWEWSINPSLRYLTASYSDDNPIRDNRRLRDIVTTPWYRESFNFSLASDQSAKVRFDTHAKGWRIATSVGGLGTGEHPHRIQIDDSIKASDAKSDVKREKVHTWLDSTISTRIALNPAVILVEQRHHEDDATAHLLAKGGWERIKFPMRFVTFDGKSEDTRPDPRDHREREGELLWPELWPEEKVRQEERDLGPYGASAQLQQTPIPEGGGLFKREYFDIIELHQVPAGCIEARGWDTADTQGGGNWTVGGRMAYHPRTQKFYITHVVRDQLESGKVNDLIINTAKLDGKKVRIAEGSGSGKAVTAARAKALLGYDYKVMSEVEDKVARAGGFRTQAESHNVLIVRAEWTEVVLDVLCHFPVGKFDDDVDSLSNAFNRLVQLIGGGQGVVIKGRDKDKARR